MLDNCERFRKGVSERIEGTVRLIGQMEATEHGNGCGPAAKPSGPSKRARSPSGDTDADDEAYKRRTRLDYNALPWNKVEGAGDDALEFSPSLQKTQALLANFA
jgi:hypothetical protein